MRREVGEDAREHDLLREDRMTDSKWRMVDGKIDDKTRMEKRVWKIGNDNMLMKKCWLGEINFLWCCLSPSYK